MHVCVWCPPSRSITHTRTAHTNMCRRRRRAHTSTSGYKRDGKRGATTVAPSVALSLGQHHLAVTAGRCGCVPRPTTASRHPRHNQQRVRVRRCPLGLRHRGPRAGTCACDTQWSHSDVNTTTHAVHTRATHARQRHPARGRHLWRARELHARSSP